MPVDTPTTPPNGPWYVNGIFWKRVSVILSIVLSTASFTLTALANLKDVSPGELKALSVSGVVINSLSVSLSALTSLDWQTQSTHDKVFAQQLCKVTHDHEGDQVVLTNRTVEGDSI